MAGLQTSYDWRYAADPFLGLTSYGAIGDGIAWDVAPTVDEYNRNRIDGDHPPGLPINHFEWSIMQTYRVTNEEYGTPGQGPAANVPEAIRLKIITKNEEVVAALRNSKVVKGWLPGYRECLRMKTATSTYGKWKYPRTCGSWIFGIQNAQHYLTKALEEAAPYQVVEARGSTAAEAQAEVVSAQRDDIIHSEEIARDAISDPDCDWWCQATSANPWLKWLLTARILLPPLFGTWLADRRQKELEEPRGGSARW